jgi:hypothetical protein
MNSVKDISEALIKIAYADKTDRIEMIAKLAKDFQSVPYSEIPQVQHELIAEIFGDLSQEISNAKTQEPTGEVQKPVKTKTTKTKPVVLQPEEIEVVEPQVVVEEPKVVIEEPKVVVSKPAPTPKPKPAPKPKAKTVTKPADDLSFLDNIDEAF